MRIRTKLRHQRKWVFRVANESKREQSGVRSMGKASNSNANQGEEWGVQVWRVNSHRQPTTWAGGQLLLHSPQWYEDLLPAKPRQPTSSPGKGRTTEFPFLSLSGHICGWVEPPRASAVFWLDFDVCPWIELGTSTMEGRCSNQLSYYTRQFNGLPRPT